MAYRLAVLFIAAATLTGAAQSPGPAAPSFEVASIKRNVSNDAAGYVRIEEGSRFNAVNASLALIIPRGLRRRI